MKLEPLPEIGAPSLAEVIGQRLAAMDVEIVHHQLNGAGKGIAANDPFQPSHQFRSRAVRSRKREVSAGA